MAAAFVQANKAQNTVGSTTLNVTLTSVAAGSLIAVVCSFPNASAFTSVTDDKGNTYNDSGLGTITNNNSTWKQRAVYAMNVASGTTVLTLTISPSAHLNIHAVEFSGVATTSALDDAQSATGTGTAPSRAYTASQTGDAVMNGMSGNSNISGITYDTDFTDGQQASDRIVSQNRINSGSGSDTASATISSVRWISMVMAFKAASGAAFLAPAPLIVSQAVKRAAYW